MEYITHGVVHSKDLGPKITLWLSDGETAWIFDPQESYYPRTKEELKKCLKNKKEYANANEPHLRQDQGIQGYISGELSYNTGVKYPLAPLNAPPVKKAHDTLIHKYGEKANCAIQRGTILGEANKSGSNSEPLGKRPLTGPPHLGGGRGADGPPGPSISGRGRGATAGQPQGRGKAGQRGRGVTFSLC